MFFDEISNAVRLRNDNSLVNFGFRVEPEEPVLAFEARPDGTTVWEQALKFKGIRAVRYRVPMDLTNRRAARGAHGSQPAVGAPATIPDGVTDRRGRVVLGTWLAAATVLLVNLAFALNNLAPYLGFNYVGATLVYSGLSATTHNHFFMPEMSLSDANTYVSIVRFSHEGVETRASTKFRAFVGWAGDHGRLVHLNLVRYQISRVCESAPGTRVRMTLQRQSAARVEFEDACAEPAFRQYAMLSGYPQCHPGCGNYLREWATNSEPAE